ncbi:caveolin-2-like [Xyrauchen texanus]|uniref:caveolin-2-like n=1 Tax=Xyrauchen texanus TaxID=154827 RepID=UPI002242AF31|nr:caveolin-2-like [Xyrauchen texanus]
MPTFIFSKTKALLKDRDPKGINKCLKVTFEDVIAEPASVRSFDQVWLWSHALFEVQTRLYRVISLLFAVPVAAGIFFAFLSCLHFWAVASGVKGHNDSTGPKGTGWPTTNSKLYYINRLIIHCV